MVVIGASAGGINAINGLAGKLPEALPMAVLVVIHMAKQSQAQIIAQQLQKITTYHCKVAEDGEELKAGYIYISPADKHMLVKPGKISLVYGPHENRWRPSIDVLFRSAAAAYGSRTVGVILSGLLDDGTSGMSAIKRSGGICIVQEPSEAEYPDMPVSVINNVAVDHRVPVHDMGYIIEDVLAKPHSDIPVPNDVKVESEITERMVSSITNMEKIGTHSNFTCPDCGGGLWELKHDGFVRYRCHTGHVYTDMCLLEKQSEQMEESIWVSIRMLEERRNLLLNLIWREKDISRNLLLQDYQRRADELAVHVERLKSYLLSLNHTELRDEGYL